jgi:hypothetical protein
MAIYSEPYFKKKLCRNSNVLITRNDVQDEAGNREAGHETCNPDERTHIAAKQCGVDQKLGKIRLHQADGRGQQTDERYTCQPLPVRQDEAECTLILREPDLRSFERHFSYQRRRSDFLILDTTVKLGSTTFAISYSTACPMNAAAPLSLNP